MFIIVLCYSVIGTIFFIASHVVPHATVVVLDNEADTFIHFFLFSLSTGPVPRALGMYVI